MSLSSTNNNSISLVMINFFETLLGTIITAHLNRWQCLVLSIERL